MQHTLQSQSLQRPEAAALFALLRLMCKGHPVIMPLAQGQLPGPAQVRKLDDTEFRNPFERAYIRVYDDSDSSRIKARDRLRSRSRCALHSRQGHCSLTT